jgi:hypothetical protein
MAALGALVRAIRNGDARPRQLARSCQFDIWQSKRKAMRYTPVAIFGLIALVSYAAVAQQTQPTGRFGTGIVCAIKGGQERSYWNEQDAIRDGAAVVLHAGDCWPRSDGATRF